MAQTTTINTRTGQRLKGAKAKPKDLQPLLDFKRSTEKSEQKIGKAVKFINDKINENKFWEFNYYNDPKEQRRLNMNKRKTLLYVLWNKLARIPGELGKGIMVKNKSKINDTTVYTDRPYRFGRDILRPKFHVGFRSPLNQQELFQYFKNNPYKGSKYGKEYQERKDLESFNRVELEFYFTFSNTYFWKPFKTSYKVVAGPYSGPFSKHSGVKFVKASGVISTRSYYYFYNVDGENLFKRSRVKYPLIIGNNSMGGSEGKISQDMSIISLKDRKIHRPHIYSNEPPTDSKFGGLSKQERDVEWITKKYYEMFKDIYGIDLIRQIQAPPMDDGLFISRIKTKKKLPQLKETNNYLYALAQKVVQGKYYYNPATNEPDLSYLSVEIVSKIE